MALRAVIISAVILTVFAIVGGPFLKIMSINIESFRIFGGLLLFLIALEMVFARSPLAFPFIAGPGALATILLAFGSAAGNPELFMGLLIIVFVVLLITLGVLYLATPAMRVLGVTGTNVISRMFGVLLGALAVQYVIDGLRGSFTS
jgi:multiple antibiotic resistance protein